MPAAGDAAAPKWARAAAGLGSMGRGVSERGADVAPLPPKPPVARTGTEVALSFLLALAFVASGAGLHRLGRLRRPSAR